MARATKSKKKACTTPCCSADAEMKKKSRCCSPGAKKARGKRSCRGR